MTNSLKSIVVEIIEDKSKEYIVEYQEKIVKYNRRLQKSFPAFFEVYQDVHEFTVPMDFFKKLELIDKKTCCAEKQEFERLLNFIIDCNKGCVLKLDQLLF